MNLKKRFFLASATVLILSLVFQVGWVAKAQTTSLDEDIEAAIELGLGWLTSQQAGDGGWGMPWECDRVARTGLVILKLDTYAIEQGMDPLSPDYRYAAQVQAGLDYIMANAHPVDIWPQPAGDPDSDGDGIGMAFYNCEQHQVYNTSIAMMALATSGHPELYQDALQDAVDFLAWAQADPDCGLNRGGWRYWGNACDSDNSNSGYATLGLGYASAAPPYGMGLTIPPFVKSELTIWLDVIQDDVNGDWDDGGSWYDPYWSWVNILKTGNLIYEFGLVGDGPGSPRVQDAVDYIERHWFDGNPDPGWRGHRQAMFTMMKGLEGMGIALLDLDGDGIPEHDWFQEVATELVATQNADGSWPWDYWGDQVLSTAWALLTLEKAVVQLATPVPVDVLPKQCPNRIYINDTGKVVVAINGTSQIPAGQIDPASVRLAGISPSLNVLLDVSPPYEPYVGKSASTDCTTAGADGKLDLVMKFSVPSLLAAVGPVAPGDVLVLHLTGNLKPEFGGEAIIGEDVVVIYTKR
ncbi:MAG: terpene cyclase/mutase family protein [Chloroflexi bacterium]|nr:terpene cyclase/mutase family protein [Chloroflexota bacterium]